MREVKSIYLDLCNIGLGHIGAYMEKLDDAIIVRNWVYDNYKPKNPICRIYYIDPESDSVCVDDCADENIHGEPLHGDKFGRCPVTPKRVFEQIVKYSPKLGLRELRFFAVDEKRTKCEWNKTTLSYDENFTYMFKVPGHFETYEINVYISKGNNIFISTHD